MLSIAAAILIVLATPSRSDQGEWKLSFGIGAANTSLTVDEIEESAMTVTVPTLEISAVTSLTDFWQLGLSAAWGPSFGTDETQAMNLQLDGRFIIDALTWVPYLAFGSGAWARHAATEGWRVDASIYGGFGIDYRPARAWSVGFLARGHVLLTDVQRSVGPFDAQLLVSIYLD